MKKQTTIFLLIAAAAAGAWYYFKNKGTDTTTAKEEETPTEGEPVKADAEVSAPKGQFFQALEKAQEVASTLKDAAVIVRSGDKTAVVKSGNKKKKKVKCPKTSAAQMKVLCEGLKGRELRQCKRKHRRSCVVIAPTQSATFSPTGEYK
jgi:hypothetical protein